jgi:hypothetical protein
MGSTVRRVLWLLVAGSVAFAIVRGFPFTNPAAAWDWLHQQELAFQSIVNHVTGKLPSNITNNSHITLPAVKSSGTGAASS